MTDERWNTLIGQLTDDGKIESKITEDLEGRPGTVERVVVKSPLGRIRLSRTSQPRKLGEKTIFAKRASSTAHIEVEYDESDVVHVFTIDKEDPTRGEWIELDPNSLPL